MAAPILPIAPDRGLDIAEPQILVRYDDDPNITWHSRVLLRRLRDAIWIWVTPDGSIQVGDLSTLQILALARNAEVPPQVAGDCYLWAQHPRRSYRPAAWSIPIVSGVRGPYACSALQLLHRTWAAGSLPPVAIRAWPAGTHLSSLSPLRLATSSTSSHHGPWHQVPRANCGLQATSFTSSHQGPRHQVPPVERDGGPWATSVTSSRHVPRHQVPLADCNGSSPDKSSTASHRGRQHQVPCERDDSLQSRQSQQHQVPPSRPVAMAAHWLHHLPCRTGVHETKKYHALIAMAVHGLQRLPRRTIVHDVEYRCLSHVCTSRRRTRMPCSPPHRSSRG